MAMGTGMAVAVDWSGVRKGTGVVMGTETGMEMGIGTGMA